MFDVPSVAQLSVITVSLGPACCTRHTRPPSAPWPVPSSLYLARQACPDGNAGYWGLWQELLRGAAARAGSQAMAIPAVPPLPYLISMPTTSLVGGPVPPAARQGRHQQRYGVGGERLVAGYVRGRRAITRRH